MPRDELKATDANLKGLLEGDKVYQAPLLQRRYVWGRKELDELWDDIDQIMAGIDKSRFLGAVVLQDRSSGLAFEPQTYWIIDGQQRLTTLYVLLLAIAILAEGRRNRRLASDIVQRLLNQSSRHVNEPKLLPTNADLRQFGDLLKERKTVTVSCPPPSGKNRGKLSKMFLMLQSDLQT